MAGQTKTFWGLRLPILLILFILTENFGMKHLKKFRNLFNPSLVVMPSSELRDDEWEELGPDIAALHRLRGLHENMFHESFHNPSSQRDPYIHGGRLQRSFVRMDTDQDPNVLLKAWQKCDNDIVTTINVMRWGLDLFLETISEQQIEDRLISASEISRGYSQKLLVNTDFEESTSAKALLEYSMDPHRSKQVSVHCLYIDSCQPQAGSRTVVKIFGRVSEDGLTVSGLDGSSLAELIWKPSLKAAPVFSLDGKTAENFHKSFIRFLMERGVNTVLEINQENHRVYKVLNEQNSFSEYRRPKRPVDPSTQYDHQQILILDNYATAETATYLYDKHPNSSSVYVLDSEHKPKLIHGEAVPLTEGSRLVLVGHGGRDRYRQMTLAWFSAKEVAKIVKETFRVSDQIKTISVVACEVGSDRAFVETLLKELRETAKIKTELHIRNAVLQVKQTGVKITQEMLSKDEMQWRHTDDGTVVVANLDRNGNAVIRNESRDRVEPVFTNERNFLYINERKRYKTFEDSWTSKPRRFIDQNIFGNMDQNALNELEALSWAFFDEDLPVPQEVDVNNLRSGDYIIGKHFNNSEQIAWISDEDKLQDILSKCFEINSGEDVRNVIRHYIKSGEHEPTYLMVNHWIYIFNSQNLFVYPVGKRLNSSQKPDEIKGLIEAQIGNGHYAAMRSKIIDRNNIVESKNQYVEYIKGIFSGEHTTNLPLETEAWSTTFFTASVISESVRNVRTFPLILMGLEMLENEADAFRWGELDFIFVKHPMQRGNSWSDRSRREFNGSATAHASRPEKLLRADVEQYQSWRNLTQGDALSRLSRTARQYIGPSTSGALGGSDDGRMTSQDLPFATKLENSFKHISHFSRLQSLYGEQIHSQLKATYGEGLARMRFQVGSARIDNGELICHLVPEVGETRVFRAQLSAESQRYNEKLMKSVSKSVKDLESHSSASTDPVNKFVVHTGTAVSLLGLIVNMEKAVNAFDTGDVKNTVMLSLQSAHGVAVVTTSAIATTALAAESRMTKAAAAIMRNPVMKRTMQVIPVVGIGYGIYNIVEDFRRGDALGYVDAVLDISTVALDIIVMVQPELAPILVPISIALSALRMVIDDVYMSIESELKSLPKDAGILEKLLAVLGGFSKGLLYFAIRVASFFYDWRYSEIKEGERLVEQISKYDTYYNITKQRDGTTVIDFASGSASWNAGGIRFYLKEQDVSLLCMDYFVSRDQKMSQKCQNIVTQGSQDIILGLGQSHSLEYTILQRKLLLFIPVGTVKVVSGYKAITDSRYGLYRGNSRSNRFFAIQKTDAKNVSEVMLSYFYKLYGEPGDDIFYLGPQRSYVEGSGGKDTYIIPKSGGKTTINNYDHSKSQDTLHFSADYSDISVSKSGYDVVFMYEGSHTVTIRSWFLGEEFRHMNMMSGDGVLFEISPTVVTSVHLVARGINKGFMTRNVYVDTLQPLLRTVTTIFGSPCNDTLIGNGENNLIDGGGGQDYLFGGEGEDIYVVKGRAQLSVIIDNWSRDQKTDLVIVEANLFRSFPFRVENDDLILNTVHNNTAIQVTLLGWFKSPEDRHLHILTDDWITFTISDKKADCLKKELFSKCIKSLRIDFSSSDFPLIVDLEENEGWNSVTEVRGSDFNDKIRGNNEHNVIIPGKGQDMIQGRGGEDWYVITPGQGEKNISNTSPDLKTDFLFLKVKYDNIKCTCEGRHLKMSVNGIIIVHLDRWFDSTFHQHLQIKSSDGVTAGLITNIGNCSSSSVMFPLIIDNRKQTPQLLISPHEKNCFIYTTKHSGEQSFCNMEGIVMTDIPLSIKEMYGSSGFDIMLGNSNDNVLDPYIGGGLMIGGEGKDTYIIKQEYVLLEINNFAEDLKTDTVRVDMDFLSDSLIELQALNPHLCVKITTKGSQFMFTLTNYMTEKRFRHLEFQTSDGVYFKLKYLNAAEPSFKIEAFKVTLNQPQGDCRLDLMSQSNLSEVHTVQGCPHLSNDILGNTRDNVLIGGRDNDALEGDEGDDTLIGGNGDDILLGGFGDDTLYGDDGNDTMLGNSGKDVFIPGPGADIMDGGPGKDAVVYTGDPETGQGVYVNLLTGQGRYADAEGDVLKDVEMVIGTIYSDILVTGYQSSLLQGAGGNDILVSTGGGYLVGGDGHDIYVVAFKKGSVTINNCADDGAIDALYLPNWSIKNSKREYTLNIFVLSLHEQNQLVFRIIMENWTDKDCQHLNAYFKDFNAVL